MVELMVVLAIVGILTTIAVPSFRETINRQKLSAASGDLYAAIILTRSEAIRRGARADLNAAGTTWAGGWTVTVPSATGAATLIQRHGPVGNGVIIDPPAFGTTLSYDGSGRASMVGNTQSITTGLWNIRVTGSTQRRVLSINAIGRPLLCDPATSPNCPQ